MSKRSERDKRAKNTHDLTVKPVSITNRDANDNVNLDFEGNFVADISPPLFIPGVDPAVARELCQDFLRGHCSRGVKCPRRHSHKSEKVVVCKHYLRGLCKKGEDCEYLHEYDLSRMPECFFWSKFGECSNPDCLYRHIDADDKAIDCPWYNRGFCKHGPKCRLKHVKREVCINYIAGFCPLGPDCLLGHPKHEVPAFTEAESLKPRRQFGVVQCHICNEKGHRALQCPLRFTAGQQ